MQLSPEKLAEFEALVLHSGAHDSFDDGHCAMEVVSWLADEGFTDAPECASPIIRRYVITLNDRWDDEKRQTLKPYLLRMIGTGSDGKDAIRERIAARYAVDLLDGWLRLAKLDAEADSLAGVTDMVELRRLVRAARVAAWALRRQRVDVIRQKVRERLAEQGKPADAAAAAAADADAAAAAAAAADADAAAAAALAAAAADAAAADADALAAAAAAAADADGESTWSAAYRAARKYYQEHPLPISQEVADLAASQQGAALELLDRLIDARED